MQETVSFHFLILFFSSNPGRFGAASGVCFLLFLTFKRFRLRASFFWYVPKETKRTPGVGPQRKRCIVLPPGPPSTGDASNILSAQIRRSCLCATYSFLRRCRWSCRQSGFCADSTLTRLVRGNCVSWPQTGRRAPLRGVHPIGGPQPP